MGGQHLEFAHAVFVVAENFQQHLAAGAGREQDVVGVEQRGVVRDEVAGLVGLELEAPAESARAPPQVVERHFGVVVKDDAVVERGVDGGAGAEGDAVEQRVHAFQRAHLHLQPETHFQTGFAGLFLFEMHLIVAADREVHLGQRDVLFRVEIIREVFVREHLLAEHNALPGIDAAECAWHQRPPAHDDAFARLVLQQNEIVIAKRHQPLRPREPFQFHVRRAVCAEGQRLQRRLPLLVNGAVGILRRIELIDDVDGLRGHAELRHKRVETDDLLLLHARL